MQTALLDLIIFNPTLKHDSAYTPSSSSDNTNNEWQSRTDGVDKDDWDSVAQVLYSHVASGVKQGEGEGKRWNEVLKQMGLARGLMGFMDMAAGPSSGDDSEDSYQIIHSKRKVTVIYQAEPDFYLLAIFAAVGESSLPANSTPKQQTERVTPVPDEHYKASLKYAYDIFKLLHGSLKLNMQEKGVLGLSKLLEAFWSRWVEAVAEDKTWPRTADLDTAKMTLQYNEAWKSLITAVRGNLTGEDDSRPCSYLGAILLDPSSILAIDGYFLDSQYSPIADYLQGQLLLTLPTTFQPSSSVDDPFSSSHHHSGSGAWKKLGLKSWGLGGGSGSSTPIQAPGSPVHDSSTPKSRAVSAGIPSSSSTTTSSSKWGGLGGWFGMGGGAEPSTSTAATSAPTTPAKQSKLVEADRTTAKEGEGDGEVNEDVDLASLHSALDSVEGDLKVGGKAEGGLEWRRRDVWLEGDERASLVYAIDDRYLLAVLLRGTGEDESLPTEVNAASKAVLRKARTASEKTQLDGTKRNQLYDASDNDDDNDTTIVYHNPHRLEVRQTPTAGRGVFAPKDMAAGEVLEESPVLVLTKEEWESGKLNDGILGSYAFSWSAGGMAVGLGIASMFNHSPNPNVNFIRRVPNKKTPDVKPALVFMTSRAIKAGEELFICYGEESKLWFSPDYGKEADCLKRKVDNVKEENPLAAMALDLLDDGPELPQPAVIPHRESDQVVEAANSSEATSLEAATNTKTAARRDKRAEKRLASELKKAEQTKKQLARATERGKALVDEKGNLVEAEQKYEGAEEGSEDVAAPSRTYQEALDDLDLIAPIATDAAFRATLEAEGSRGSKSTADFDGWDRITKVFSESEEAENALDSTVDVWIATLPSRDVGVMLKFLRHRNWYEDYLTQLKRVQKDEGNPTISSVAVCLLRDIQQQDLERELQSYDAKLVNLNLIQRAVPTHPGRTLDEVAAKRHLWPVAYQQRILPPSYKPWSPHRKAWVYSAIQRIVEEARANKTRGEMPIAMLAASPPIEAIIPDPDAIPPTPDIRSCGVDTGRAEGHPLRHATMNCVKDIARLRTLSPFSDVLATRNGAAYLLTSLSVFITHEPCVMCAMALVHSRVKEIFFLIPTKQAGGGFGGSYNVHDHPGLNHKIDLYDCSGLISREAMADLAIPTTIDA